MSKSAFDGFFLSFFQSCILCWSKIPINKLLYTGTLIFVNNWIKQHVHLNFSSRFLWWFSKKIFPTLSHEVLIQHTMRKSHWKVSCVKMACHFSSLFFSLFRATPMLNESSQARGQIRATSASYSNAGSLTHWVRPGIEPVSSWILVGFLYHWTMTGIPFLDLNIFLTIVNLSMFSHY